MSVGLGRITAIVCAVGKISEVGVDDDFYDAGFSSINSLELLLQLEEESGVSIPDDQFIAARSPRALHEMIERIERLGQGLVA